MLPVAVWWCAYLPPACRVCRVLQSPDITSYLSLRALTLLLVLIMSLQICPYMLSLQPNCNSIFPQGLITSRSTSQPLCIILQLMLTKRYNAVAVIPWLQSSPWEAGPAYLSAGSLWQWQAGCQRQWWGRQSSPAAGWSWRRPSLRCRAANRNQQCPSPSGRCWAAAGSQCRTTAAAGSPPGRAGWQPQWQPRGKGSFG